jgi:hypothetical protein
MTIAMICWQLSQGAPMNKRIQKKVAKRQQQEQPGVAGAYHEIEQGIRDLAQALMTQGKEQSAAAIAAMAQKLEHSEESLEQLVAKVPGLGPQLAGMLHNLTHDEPGQSESPAPPPNGKKTTRKPSVRPSAGTRS